jgi:transcription elongation factor Elf1
MTTKTSPLKRAIKAATQAMAGQRYGTQAKPFLCPFCGHDLFKAGPTALILSLHTLACAECGRVEFFSKLPRPIPT